MQDEGWIPLVDDAVGEIVARIEEQNPDLGGIVGSPQRLLAFRTFAYIRVGLVLGELLVDHDVGDPHRWVDEVAREPAVWQRLVAEVRGVAEEVAREAKADEAAPDDEIRRRFQALAKRALAGD